MNVGTGKDISIKALAEIISKEFKFKGTIFWDTKMPDGTPRKLLNIEKFKHLGWSAKINLKKEFLLQLKTLKKI